MKILYSLRKFREDEIAQERMRIIKFYEEYGEKATKKAFGADRKVINRWQKRLKENGGTLSSLVPSSTRPHRVRHSTVSQEIINFIKDMREEYPRIGKEKLKPILDKYCEDKGLKPISESTIGDIIKRLSEDGHDSNLSADRQDSKWAQNRIKRTTRLKIKHLTGWKFLSLIFAFFYLISYSAICFASTINNSALISYKIGSTPQQISTNSISTTVNGSSVATIIAPQNNSTVPPNFVVIGTTTANASVEIKIDGLTRYTLTSDSNGYYGEEVSIATIGSHTITVYANGIEGESAVVNVVSGLPANYPEITSPEDGARIYTRRPTIIGKSSPNSPIVVYAKASPLRIVSVGSPNNSGNFTINLNQDLPSGNTQLFILDTGNNLSSEAINVVFIDPDGVVFDSVSNNPIKGAQVTLYNATTNQPCTPGVEIALLDANPQITGVNGYYNFNAVNGNYYLRVSAAGYTFPSALSSFPRTIAAGSKGEQFTVAGLALTINLPLDAQNSLLRVEKTANKKEVSVGDIITYTVSIQNPTASDITNIYLEDKIPAGFKYINGRVILDNAAISDPTGNRPLTFNIGTVTAGQTRTLKYQLIVGSGVTFGNYENTAWAKYSDGAVISNKATETVRVVPDPLFDLGTVIGKVFLDRNENGIQDQAEEPIPSVQIVTEDGAIITTDKDGKFHLAGIIPGRHLFRLDERSLPEGAYLTTDKAVIVDITPGILAKVNFGVNREQNTELRTCLPDKQAQSTDNEPRSRDNTNSSQQSRETQSTDNKNSSQPTAEASSITDIKEHTTAGSKQTSETYEKPKTVSRFQELVKDFIFVALADVKAGYTDVSGNIEPVEQDDKYTQGFWQEGRAAYYLKGKIKGKYLITSSLDTERDKKELFKNLDPDKYYPVYGDSSSVNYDAANTLGMLYLLIEWDKSSLLWGNYNIAITDTELASFNRTLYGGKVHYETVSTTQFSEPKTKLIIFKSIAGQKAAHNEFTGTGGSLYYLKNKDIIEGSDKIKIEVRDKITGLVLAAKEMKEGVNYEIDYSNGRVIFWQPISYITESDSIISTHLLDGNPVYVVVDYEYEVKDKYDEGTYGGRVQQSITDYLKIGGTYVKEEQLNKDYELIGTDATIHLGKNIELTGEYAESQSEGVGSFISTDGGLRFTELATGDLEKGRAYGLKGKANLFNKLGLTGYYKKIRKGFSSTSTASQQGKELLGAGLTYDLSFKTRLKITHNIQKLIDNGNLQTQLQVGAQKTQTTTAQLTHEMEKLKLTGEYRHQEVTEKKDQFVSETNTDEDTVALRGDYKVTAKTTLFLEQQSTLKGASNHQTTAGIDTKVNEYLSLRAKETIGAQGDATSLGATVKADKFEVYGDYTHTNYNTGDIGDSASIGSRIKLDDKSEIYNTLSVSNSATEGEKTVSVIGAKRKLNDKLEFTTEKEYTSTKEETSNANIFGLSGDINDKWAGEPEV
ncbi:MAG: hypothetical protein Q8N09_06020 [Thermodesulfovibrionia bacterium]|nr:hypothetical protein [Thermodesulfovibrionia bacterium]